VSDTPTDILQMWPLDVAFDASREVMALMTAYHDEQGAFRIEALLICAVNN